MCSGSYGCGVVFGCVCIWRVWFGVCVCRCLLLLNMLLKKFFVLCLLKCVLVSVSGLLCLGISRKWCLIRL